MKTLTLIIFSTFLITGIQSCKTFDATVESNEICRVHEEEMKVTRTWIKYGLREMKKVETDILEYPHPKINHCGGCRIYDGRPRIYKYYYCTKCNRAKNKEK